MKRPLLLAVAIAVVAAPGASAQSLFSGATLGMPHDALDARSRALGSVGVGLWGGSLLPGDPAAAADLVVPTAIFSAQPSWVDFRRGDTGETATFQGTRFPLVGIAYPAWKLGMATFTVGSFLDQRFEARRETTAELEDGPVPTTDRFRSRGGVSEIRLGLARFVTPTLRVALAVGRYNGSVVRQEARSLDSLNVEGSVREYRAGGRWSYSGTSVTAGAALTVGTVLRLAGSATLSGDLKAEASSDTKGEDRTYDLPLRIQMGGTAVLAPGLSLSASVSTADWQGTVGDTPGAGRDVNYGVGIELGRARLLGREAPLRIGYRKSDLPFGLEGGRPTEKVFTGGLGLSLSKSNSLTLASLDVALERGKRTEGPITEKFWRSTLTVRVSGF